MALSDEEAIKIFNETCELIRKAEPLEAAGLLDSTQLEALDNERIRLMHFQDVDPEPRVLKNAAAILRGEQGFSIRAFWLREGERIVHRWLAAHAAGALTDEESRILRDLEDAVKNSSEGEEWKQTGEP